ncbi:MAG: hypothetical protein VCB26_09135 [Candidatus Hydrogenedentota bacterium]
MNDDTSNTNEHDTNQERDPFADKVPIERRPLRTRIILFLIMLVIVSIAFYFANQIMIEYYRNR